VETGNHLKTVQSTVSEWSTLHAL